jgi:hypothetical protein
MKTTLNIALAFSVFGIVLTSSANCFAQTQIVTLAVNSQYLSRSNAVATNQVVQIVSLTGTYVVPNVFLYHSSGIKAGTTNIGTYTGLTNIEVDAGNDGIGGYSAGLATFQITTPETTTVISNYVPADAIVISSSVTGNVQIILESSPDLVNWTAAEPGTYGASAGTNRFFRVRAVASP